MTAVGIVPARYGSARFPGKPLVLIDGVPMVVRVAHASSAARKLRAVLVATDDERIESVCRAHGVAVTRTGAYPTGTDRIAFAAETLSDEIVVNIQGDEPLIEPDAIDALVERLHEDPALPMATAVHPLDQGALEDPNRVKAWISDDDRALVFERRCPEAKRAATAWQHIGLYAYRRAFLHRFVDLTPTAGERAQGLEQLRALEHGHAIGVVRRGSASGPSVDVPEDVARVEAVLRARANAGAA